MKYINILSLIINCNLKFLIFVPIITIKILADDFILKAEYANKEYRCRIEESAHKTKKSIPFHKFRLGCTFFQEEMIGYQSGSLMGVIVHKNKGEYLKWMERGNQSGFLPMTNNCFISVSHWKAINPLDFKKYKLSPEKYEKYRINFLDVFEMIRKDIANTEFCR